MSDFAVLGTIRSYLATHLGDEIVAFGGGENLEGDLCCLLELEEVWTHMKVGADAIQSCVKFKTVCVNRQIAHRQGIELNEKVLKLLDGQIFKMDDGRTAIIRSLDGGSQIHHGKDEKTVSQLYESLIRG